MKHAAVFIILLYIGCFLSRAKSYHLSFVQIDGGFRFCMMEGTETGDVRGFFRKPQKPYLLPEPEVSVTLGLDLAGKSPVHHLYSASEIVTFGINRLFFKIESDRTITLWGGDKDDCVWIYNRDNLNLRLACEHFSGVVMYRLKEDEAWKPIIIKTVNK